MTYNSNVRRSAKQHDLDEQERHKVHAAKKAAKKATTAEERQHRREQAAGERLARRIANNPFVEA